MINEKFIVVIRPEAKTARCWYSERVGRSFIVSKCLNNLMDAYEVINTIGNRGEDVGRLIHVEHCDIVVSGIAQSPIPHPVSHPAHYGGADNPYEAIKVIEAWGLGFNLGNVVKYISRAGKKGDRLEDLKKAAWYLQREIGSIEKKDEPHTDKTGNDGC